MSLPALIGLLVLVVGFPLNLYVTAKLWRLSRERPDIGVLRERAVVSGFSTLRPSWNNSLSVS